MSRRTIKTHNSVSKTLTLHSALERSPVVQLVPTATLKPNPQNPRTHSKKQITKIANSILQFGFTSPVLTDEHDNVIAGHGRLLAAQQLGLRDVPVIKATELTDVEKRALALADNKLADDAGYDRKILATELGYLAVHLPEIELDLSITGFEPAELDGLMGDFADPEQDPADELPPPRDGQSISQIDDLWGLGHHRLLCEDACDERALRRLMGRERAATIFADSPYNLRIGAIVGRGKIKHPEFLSASGEMSPAQFIDFLTKWMKLAARFSENGSIHFVCIDWRHLHEVLAAGNAVYSELKNVVVWVKSNAGQGSFYRSQHEFIFVFKNGDGPHQNNVELGKHGRNRSNVWTYAGVNTFRAGRLDELAVHPTVKPLALVADAMRDCSRRGDIILDPFMGSGTTILAAERIGRRAYGLEIEPIYVDVAIRRWQAFTKRDAILKTTGQTFDEVAEERRTPKIRRIR